MKSYLLSLLYLTIFITNINYALALVPVDSLILGANDSDVSTNTIDPLNYVFNYKFDPSEKNEKKQIMYFYSLILGSYKLENYCKKQLYPNYYSKEQLMVVERSLLATLQFIGLDLSIRAIASYAKALEFSEEEYKNLTTRLINNYCSSNVTVVSLRQIKENLLSKFINSEKSDYILPDFSINHYFPPNIDKRINITVAKEQELLRTIKLFRSFCSWDGNLDNLRLLVPLVKNTIIMSFVIEQLSGIQSSWNNVSKKFNSVSANNTIQIICENLICRPPIDKNSFYKNFPRSLGGKDIEEDLKIVYCNNLQDVKYTYNNQEPHVKKWINNQTIEDENFLISQFLSLLTSVPDPIGRVQNYSELKEVLRSSLDNDWDIWAQKATNTFVTDLLYEESMTIEVIPNSKLIDKNAFHDISYNSLLKGHSFSDIKKMDKYTKEIKKHFQIAFDINLGEFDRTLQVNGKIETHYKLFLPESFLSWFQHEWFLYAHPKYKEKRNKLREVLQNALVPQIIDMRKKFLIAPWEGNLQYLIASEIIDRLEDELCPKLQRISDKNIEITIIFHYGIWALKYINYRFNSLHGNHQIDN
ncbi:MAG: hypothetical protein HQK51_13540 [Oligoflexia bacterium]|nr:hypothetical protein [Oligoflexia bacterium]